MGHVADIFLNRGNFSGQVDHQHLVFGAHVPDGLIEPVKGALEFRIGNPLAEFQLMHHLLNQGVGVVRKPAGLGHEHRDDAPGPANIDKRLEVQGKFPNQQILVDGDFLAPDPVKLVSLGFAARKQRFSSIPGRGWEW